MLSGQGDKRNNKIKKKTDGKSLGNYLELPGSAKRKKKQRNLREEGDPTCCEVTQPQDP